MAAPLIPATTGVCIFSTARLLVSTLVRTSDSCVDIQECGKSPPYRTWELENSLSPQESSALETGEVQVLQLGPKSQFSAIKDKP